MPSIRGYKKGIDNQALKQAIDRYTAHIATVAANAGKAAMKEIRTKAVESWYHSTASTHMNSSTKVESDPPKQGDKKIEITIRSYIDINMFEASKQSASERNMFSSPYESVKRWRERHEKNGWRYYGREQVHMDKDNLNRLGTYQPSREALSMPYSIGEFLFRLPWEEGIVGLPPHERFTGTGWDNPAKNITREKSLREYVEDILVKKWARTVNKKMKEINK